MARVWVEAFYSDETQILGNGDGQAMIDAKNYKRTNSYKDLKIGYYKRPAYWRIVNDKGDRLETVYNNK